MKDNKWLFFSALLLSSSIIFSSVYLGSAIKHSNTSVTSDVIDATISSPDLLSKKEAAEYLNLSDKMFNLLLKKEEEQKTGLRSYSTHRFIHSLDLYGQIYYSKEQLDEWIKYHLYNEY